MRPCTCEKEKCPLCWKYHNDDRYKKLWDRLPARSKKPVVKTLEAKPTGDCGCNKKKA